IFSKCFSDLACDSNDFSCSSVCLSTLFSKLLKLSVCFVSTSFMRSCILRSEEHTSELQSRFDLVCRLLLEKKKELFDDNAPYAMIDISRDRRKINIGLLKEEGIRLEDGVLIHVGLGMNKSMEVEGELPLDI